MKSPKKKVRKLDNYGLGGEAGNQLLSQAPSIIESIIGLLDNNSYSKQPIVNAGTMRTMSNPYSGFAMGGSIDDLDEDQLASLQQMADEQGVSVEELLAQMQDNSSGAPEGDDPGIEDGNDQEDDSDSDDSESSLMSGIFNDQEYAYGGIHIKKKNKGKFNALKKKTGKSTAELTHSKNPLTRKRAIFAQNAKKWKHAYGGTALSHINVEGGEAIETPNGNVSTVSGPKHEQGGVDVKVPSGTKIFSDRLSIDDKSMKDRKLKREASLKRMHKLLEGDPTSSIIKNTVRRTTQNLMREDAQDVTLQNLANKLYAAPSSPQPPDKADPQKGYAFGGLTDGVEEDDPYYPLPPLIATGYPGSTTLSGTTPHPTLNPGIIKPTAPSYKSAGAMTSGDYIGMAGNLFNAIAPIINTNADRRASKPNINRYLGFGHKAIDANDQAQGYIAGLKTSADTDADTNANTAYQRNRNSATGVNTIRALDIGTDMIKDKAHDATNDSFSKSMIGLLGERAEQYNLIDKMEMAGQTGTDIENKADIDNYYSNLAGNLTNFGTNVQGIGRSLNVAKSNKVNANLLSQLSLYGLEFDDDGNLVNKKKK